METERTRVRRKPERARYDRSTIDAILDEAPICHVGFVRDGTPIVIPTIHARIDDTLYLHGSTASGMLNALATDAQACVTATVIDGYVLARSTFHHSMNYRSVVVLGRAEIVADADEKLNAMRALVDRIAPGRWDEVRAPSAKEFAATLIVKLPIEEASAKVRTGPPIDDEEDYAQPIWAGVLPVTTGFGEPIPDSEGIEPPASVRALRGTPLR